MARVFLFKNKQSGSLAREPLQQEKGTEELRCISKMIFALAAKNASSSAQSVQFKYQKATENLILASVTA